MTAVKWYIASFWLTDFSLTYTGKSRVSSKNTTVALSVFGEWQFARTIKVPVLDPGGVFKDYDLHKVATLSTGIEGMDALSLNYWLSKFVMEVAKKTGERYPAKTIYGIVCGIRRHLEEKNGKMEMFDLRWKTCFISDENLVVFHLVFHWRSRFIHLTQMEVIYWLLTAWIINEFESCI